MINRFHLIMTIAVCCIAGRIGAQDQLEIPVRILVQGAHGTDTNVLNTIESEFLTELRGKSNIVVVKDSSLYTIFANAAEIKSTDGQVIGLALSTVLTRSIVSESGRRNEYFTSIICALDISQLRKKCIDLIANFDVNYFEREREHGN